MKLQIISRLTKRESCPLDLDQRSKPITKFISTQSTEVSEKINQYYSISTQSNVSRGKQQRQRNTLRDFFNHFDVNCEVRHRDVDIQPKEVKRKLQGILHSIKKKHSFIKLQTTQSKEAKQQNTMQNMQPPWIQQQKPPHLQLDPKQSYYYQRVQKIKKVNSLISLDNQQSTDSTRKPGFIRLNRSIARKQSSLSKLVMKPKHCGMQQSQLVSTMANSRSGSAMQVQINESKERIAKIRRELNEVYLMRNRGDHRLKLL